MYSVAQIPFNIVKRQDGQIMLDVSDNVVNSVSSIPPSGKKQINNIYYDPVTGTVIAETVD